MRYFMIGYVYKNASGGGFGTHFTASIKFPSVKSIVEYLKQPIVIISAFEFKNEEDYLNAQNID